MKPELYILELSIGQYYIGSTSDLNRRILEHERGKVTSTKGKRPLRIVFRRELSSIKEARQIEYKLKSYKNKKIVKQIIADQKIKFIQ